MGNAVIEMGGYIKLLLSKFARYFVVHFSNIN